MTETIPENDVQVTKTVPVADLTHATIGAAMGEHDVPEDAFIYSNNGGGNFNYPSNRPYQPSPEKPYLVTFTWSE